MKDLIRSTLQAQDGVNIALWDWPLDNEKTMRGLVLIVHGLGEHAGRYETVARQLNKWGFAVRAYDQYGHGESGGIRGRLPSDNRLLEDLASVIDASRTILPADKPLILFGHSMGGVVAARLVSMGIPVQGLVLSSPALDPGLTRIQRLLLAVLIRMAPDLCVGNGLNPHKISRDTQTVTAYQHDPQIHDRISARLGRFIAQEGSAVRQLAKGWGIPTLLLYAGDDQLVNPTGSVAFAQAAPAHMLEAHCFPNMYHEIFNEPEGEQVYSKLKAWLDSKI